MDGSIPGVNISMHILLDNIMLLQYVYDILKEEEGWNCNFRLFIRIIRAVRIFIQGSMLTT